MNVDWTWFIIGLLAGVFFGAAIKGAVGNLKGKVAG